MLYIAVSLLHVVFAIALILIVLLQTGKGSDLASAFGGGGSNTLFGSAGTASFLNKITTLAAILFMVTSLSLAVLSGSAAGDSELDLPPPIEDTLPEGPGLPLESTASDGAAPVEAPPADAVSSGAPDRAPAEAPSEADPS